MNILQLCKYYPPILGGIELVEKTITKAHADLNDKSVIVAFSKFAGESIGEFSEQVYNIKQDVFFKSAPINFGFVLTFRKLIRLHKIERVYVHLPNPFMHEVLRLSSQFLKNSKVEVVAVYHSDIVNQKFLGALYTKYFLLSKNIYDSWICSSQKLWDSSPVLSKVDPHKKKVIPFCTEGNIHYRERDKFKGKLLAVGRLVPYKGFDFLIKAINKTSYQLHIIGNGPEFEKLKSMAGKNIIFHRNLNDKEKNELFDQSDLLIVSSVNRAEAYGMIIVEAFEAGLPVVSSNLNSGVTYLVQHEKTGLIFETKNEEELISAIKRIEEDDGLYRQISINTRVFFDSVLSYRHFKDKISNL